MTSADPRPAPGGAATTSGKVSEAVSRVEAELSALWAPAPAGEDSPGAAGRVRASTMNLCVVAASSELERLRDTTDELNQTHAGRSFLVTVDPRLAPWEIQTAVSAVCRSEGGSDPICSDRIELALGAMVAPRAASILATLALSEVPTVIEAGRGAPAAVVESLARAADRIVVDTSHTDVARVAALARAVRVPIADRAFIRTFTWRELTARFFDDATLAARSIRRLEIGRTASAPGLVGGTPTPGSGTNDPAPLFIGWMASRLGWELGRGGQARDASGGAVEIAACTEEVAGVGPGELTRVSISTALGGSRLECSIRRIAPRSVRWTMTGGAPAEHEHPLGFRDETWVLIKAIDSTEGDRVYREAVLAAAAWSGS